MKCAYTGRLCLYSLCAPLMLFVAFKCFGGVDVILMSSGLTDLQHKQALFFALLIFRMHPSTDLSFLSLSFIHYFLESPPLRNESSVCLSVSPSFCLSLSFYP